MTVGDKPTARRGHCVACGHVADLRLIRPQPTSRHRVWKCVQCIERRRQFAESRRAAVDSGAG